MSLWNSFLDRIAKPVGRAIESSVKGVGEGFTAAGFTPNALSSPSNAIASPIIKAGVQMTVPKITSAQGLDEKVQQEIAKNIEYSAQEKAVTGDLVLRVANEVVAPIVSKGITRPIATFGLVTDFNSPLYQPGKYEKGFQLNDIKAAYNRSEEVTAMQALTKSDLLRSVNPLGYAIQDAIFSNGNIDINKVNLWDDEDVKKNFSDNVVGRYYTGGGDFILSNAAITAAGGAAGAVFKSFGKMAGLTTKNKALATFEEDVSIGLDHFNSGGQTGKYTLAANDVKRLADTTKVDDVIDILGNYTVNPRMIDTIVDTTDVNIVKDLILADNGNLAAMNRLLSSAPATIGEVAGVKSVFVNKAMDNGGVYHPEGLNIDRINALYDDGIKLPEHKKYYETFMDPINKSPRMGGTGYAPIEPIIGAQKIGTALARISSARAASVSRDFTDIGGFTERFLGNRFVTRVISFTGSYKPLGYVTFSGARPLDGIVEIDAMFDDLKLFKNGNNLITINAKKETMKASDYRNAVKTNFLRAESDIKRKEILEALDRDLGFHLAYTNNFFDEVQILDSITNLRAKISGSHAAFGQTGMGIDAQGHRVITDPLTQRQLVESHRFLPWNVIEKEIIKGAESGKLKRMGVTGFDVTKEAFEFANRYWTLDVLARPSYIPKQSLAEPTLSAFLAQGTGYIVNSIPTAAKRSLQNNRNRVLNVASRLHNKPAIKSIQKVVDDLTTQLDIAVNNLNALNAEADAFYKTTNVSPVAKATNGPKVVDAVKRAEAMVDDIELELLSASKPFGSTTQVPTFARLERRINFLEESTAVSGKYGIQIANARAALGAAKAETHTLLPNASELIKKNIEISKQYDIIDDALKSLGEAKYKEALVLGKGAEYKKRFFGKEENYRVIDNKYTKLDSLYTENQLGAAMREETGNASTVAITYLNELSMGTRQSILMRKTPNTVTDVSSPLYFEELAYVANRAMRGDPLINQILADIEFNDLVKWGQSPSGMAYMEQFGGQTLGNVPDFIRNRVSFVNRYLPNKVAREAVLKGEVTSVQLQTILAKDLDVLTAIHPTEFNYNAAHEGFQGVKDLVRVDKALSWFARKTFNALAKPENPIRWSFADKVFLDTLAKKANILAQQGEDMSGPNNINKINAIRQSATIEAVKETEKTFYTIRRPNRAAYVMRTVTAFPSASLNAFYRYGRFAIQNPTRVTGFLNSYNSMFTTFGIDQYGNPAEDVKDVTHIVMPLTKELGLFNDKGVRLSARSIGFLLNLPGPSFFMAAPISQLMKSKPSAEDTLKEILGSNYDIIFPYGPQSSISQALTPGWLSAANAYIFENESRADYLNSLKSVMNYYRTLEDMKIQKFPGMDKVREDVKNLYLEKAKWTFASPLGVPIKVDTDPMKLYDDYFSVLTEKWLSKGYERIEAKKLAGFEMLSHLGSDFKLDRVTYKGVTQKAYIPAQLENYKRVFEQNDDLVASLANYDPKLVSLLTLDVPVKKEDFNLSIYRILNNPKTKLPGNILLNDLALSPEQEETERQINRAWTDYNEKRDKLQSLALTRGKRTLAAADLDVELERYAKEVIAVKSPEWFKRFNDPKAPDNSFMYAQGLGEIVNNVKFMAKHGNSKLWQDVQGFLSIRNMYTEVYQTLGNGDRRKSQLKNMYNSQVAANISQWDPALQELITRYFINDTMKITQVGIK
jgi:hypothetical protein